MWIMYRDSPDGIKNKKTTVNRVNDDDEYFSVC